MEFFFSVNRALPERVTVVQGVKNRSTKRLSRGGEESETEYELEQIVDAIGVASAKAQGLQSPITTYNKLVQSDHTLYILKEESAKCGKGSVLGIIRTGKKRLFLMDPSTALHEVEPLCILDFYVHESQQRKGYGKVLFEFVLKKEKLMEFEVAIDRPSFKFLSFLQKHYHLSSHIKQNNNFVVFNKFFTTCVDVTQSNRRRSLSPPLPSFAKPGNSMDMLGLSHARSNNQNSVPMKWTTTTGEATPRTFTNQAFPQHHISNIIAPRLTRERDDVIPSQLRERDDVIAPHLTLRNRWRRQATRQGPLSTIFGESAHSNTLSTPVSQNMARYTQPIGGSLRYSRHLPPQESDSGLLHSTTSRDSARDMSQSMLARHSFRMHQLPSLPRSSSNDKT